MNFDGRKGAVPEAPPTVPFKASIGVKAEHFSHLLELRPSNGRVGEDRIKYSLQYKRTYISRILIEYTGIGACNITH